MVGATCSARYTTDDGEVMTTREVDCEFKICGTSAALELNFLPPCSMCLKCMLENSAYDKNSNVSDKMSCHFKFDRTFMFHGW